MHTRLRVIVALGLGLLLSACGGSAGGGGSHVADTAACSGAGCERDNTVPTAPLVCAGRDNATCPQGYRCIDDPTDSCDPATGGADCGGTCVLGEELPHCGRFGDAPCAAGSVCVDDPTDACEGGPAIECPGICRPKAVGGCTADTDCPQLDVAVCNTCADGSVSCPSARCNNGECTVDFKACPESQVCGGISGLSCSPGFKCVDDPTDECTPDNGAADCRGICVPQEQPLRCNGIAGDTCPAGLICVDDPNDMCDPQVGADCPGVCQPDQGGQCTSDAECPTPRAPCSVCADGTAACPRSFCEAGRCNIVFPTCPQPPPVVCGDDGSGCKPGDICVADPNGMCDPATGGGKCLGVCIPSNQPRPCGGFMGATCPDGYTCVDDRRDTCNPDANGADCPGICEPGSGGECTTDAECPVLPAPCSVCADGTETCPRSFCVGGHCTVGAPACPMPPPIVCGDNGNGCKPGDVCVADPKSPCDPATGSTCLGTCVPGSQPRPCGGLAGTTCPTGYQCVDDQRDDCKPDANGADCPGVCEVTPPPPPQCRADDECAMILASCSLCPDGSYACPRPQCKEGMCAVVFDACKGPGFCGGIVGFPCPPGSTCVDDPNDDCDPQHGGADCGGICVREEEPPQCGAFTGKLCPGGFDCVDDPRDECNPDAGGADCPGICKPAPNPACTTDADCPLIGAPCQLCADGTAACPRSSCVNGQCKAEFQTCKGAP